MVTPRLYSRITAVALALLAAIVVTGAAVRLTGSGLGCPEWPTCGGGRVIAPLEYHAMVEFVNRVVTGFVSLTVIVAVLGSLVRVPRRRDLVWLSIGLVAGVVGQIVLGGLVVLFHLWPPLVMGHFVVSMALIADATVLHHRARQPDDGEIRLAVAPAHRTAGRLLLAAAAVVIVLGTVVTGAGPHAGNHDGQLVDRLPVDLGDVARLHGLSVMVFLALTLVTIARLISDRVAPDVVRRGATLLAVLVAQAAIGYAQYFLGVPAMLVALHVAGATAVWVTSLRLYLSMHVRVRVDEPVAVAAA